MLAMIAGFIRRIAYLIAILWLVIYGLFLAHTDVGNWPVAFILAFLIIASGWAMSWVVKG